MLVPDPSVAAASDKIRSRYELRAVNPEEALRWYDQLDRTVQQLALRSAVIQKSVARNLVTVTDSGGAASAGVAGTLLVKSQGMQHWRSMFGYAFEGALRLYAAEADCPHDTSGSWVDVATDVPEPDLKSCLERLGKLDSTVTATICANVTVGDVREYGTDEEYWRQLGQSLGAVSSEQWQLFCAALPTLLDVPAEAETPRGSGVPWRKEDLPLAVVDLSILDSSESIELHEAGAADVAHIAIKSDGIAIHVRAVVASATVVWHTRLRQLWDDATSPAGLLALSKLPESRLVAGFDRSGAGDPALGRTQAAVQGDRNATVDEIFVHEVGRVVGSKVDWPTVCNHIADHVQPVIGQTERLMDEMALGLLQAASRQDVAGWWVAAFYSRFIDMLHGFSSRTAPVSGDTQAYDINDAIAIIHWCKQFSERCGAMGIDSDAFDADPTEHGVYQALSNAHMPSYRGELQRPNATFGWNTRYFNLSDGYLRYFSSESMEHEHNCIPGEMITAAEIDTADTSGRRFSITWAGKLTALYAASSDEAQIWVERINKARDAAAAMERFAAARTCFEVESFDFHREVGRAKVRKDCSDPFDAAARDLSGSDNSVLLMMRLMEAADLLIEQLGVRVERIPADRSDVKQFFVELYHECISERIFAGVSPELSKLKARDVCHFLFWTRHYDKAIGLLQSGPMTQHPLAAATAWDDALPGFTTHRLPMYSGWVQQQYNADRSWSRVWFTIEDSVARWYSDETAHHILGTMVLAEDAEVNKHTDDSELDQLHVRTRKDTLFLQVSSKDIGDLHLCLIQSIHPVLPGETARSILGDDDFATREAANAWIAEYREHSHEELQSMMKENFAKRTHEKVADLQSKQPAQEFGLVHVLELLTTIVDELVDIVDPVILTMDDDTGDSIESALVHFHIITRHKLLEECTKNLCDPETPVFNSGCNVTVNADNVCELLSWVSNYSCRLQSLGVTIRWETERTDSESQSTAAHPLAVEPLQFLCKTPMAEFVELQRITLQDLLANLAKVEADKRQVGRRAGTSLPMDLFEMIRQVTDRAAAAASQWVLVNTVEGVIIPQVRVWASDFTENLRACNESPEYFCRCINDMNDSQQLFRKWNEELEQRITTVEMMSDHGDNDLRTASVSSAFRAIRNTATERLCEVLLVLASNDVGPGFRVSYMEALTYSNRKHKPSTGIPDWPGRLLIREMLENLRCRCSELDDWLGPAPGNGNVTHMRKELMATTIRTYEQHLLKMSRAPKVTSWGLQGARRGAKRLEEFISADIADLQKFFVEELNREVSTVRRALQKLVTISELFGCPLDDFEAQVQKAAGHPEFSVDTVRLILEARDDITPHTRDVIVRSARATIAAIHEALLPTLPPRPAGGPTIAPQSKVESGDDNYPRVVASYSYNQQEHDDLSFEPGHPSISSLHAPARPRARASGIVLAGNFLPAHFACSCDLNCAVCCDRCR